MNYWLPPAKTGEVRYAYEDWYPKPGTSIAGQPDPPLYLIGSWGMVNRADWSISEESDTWAYQQWTCTTWCGGPGQYYSYPGISYSPYGGITIGAPYYTVKPITIYVSNNYETTAPTLLSGTTTYSMVRAADLYDTFTPKFGRCDDGTWAAGCGKTYRNVINLLLVHGVTGLNVCANMPSSLGHVPGYTSYWIQFFLAPGKNYVARRVLFDERSCHGWLIDGKAHYQEESIDE